ncbi:hypothetical protein PCANB_000251 [Pneumocystis canis]|nr:hypothetical protein PCK1_000102 [Pneumocystis canis]KAG5439969.1 hypothetical protein PCANB_000251 [Pneumocystis canis]
MTLRKESVDKKYDLIVRHLQEVLGSEKLKEILKERNLKIYWGTSPTGRPHCGYFVPMIKIADFLKSGAEVTILLADIHAFLDNLKASIDIVKYRAKYYELIIKAMLKSIGVPVEKLHFVLGSSYQLTSAYSMDNFRLCTTVTEHDAKKAGSEVVKQIGKAFLSGLLYPGMQALDEEKMSASGSENNKIDILDDAETVKKKINKAFCADGVIENNGLLAFAKYIIFPILELKGTPILEISKKQGDSLFYNCYDLLETDYANQKLFPQDLKLGITDALNYLLEPIRMEFKENKEFQEILHFAYPDEKKKKPKKIYNKDPKSVQSKHTVLTQNHNFHLKNLQTSTSSLSIK